MKKITLLLSAVMLLFVASCDDLEDYISIEFQDVEIAKTLSVPTVDTRSASTVPTDANGTSFSSEITFSLDDATGDSQDGKDLANFIDQVSSVEMKSIAFEVLNTYMDVMQTDFVIHTLHITISSASVNVDETFTDITPGSSIISTVILGKLDKIGTALQNGETITFKAEGTQTGAEKGFDMVMNLIADIEAKPLAD